MHARVSKKICEICGSSLDLEAPSGETGRRIKVLISKGKPITLALFPHAEHGMTEYEVAPDGERVSTRYAPGYFAMMRDFARNGQLSDSYGSSVIEKPKADQGNREISNRLPGQDKH